MRYKGHSNDHALSTVAKDRICLFLFLQFPSSWYYAFSQYGMRWKKLEEVWDGGGGQLVGFCDSKIHRVCLSVGFRWRYVMASVTSGPQWAKSKVRICNCSLRNVWPVSKLAGCRPLASRRAKLWRVNSEDFHVGDLVIDIAGWDGDTLLWYCVHFWLFLFLSFRAFCSAPAQTANICLPYTLHNPHPAFNVCVVKMYFWTLLLLYTVTDDHLFLVLLSKHCT